MKKLTLTTICTFFAIAVLAQAPQGISHQAVIRNAANELVSNSPIGIQVSIIQGSTDGDIVYSETHLPVSNTNGLISFIIGQGTDISGMFAEIDWSDGPYFIETKADPTGGTAYTIEGISQMLSVPYALHAKTAESISGSVENNIMPPVATILPAIDIELFSATFNGTVNAKGFLTNVVFEWGSTTAYGNTITAIQSPVKGTNDVLVNAFITGLQSATTYHYRLRASNAVDVIYSDDILFNTLASPPQLTTNVVTNILAFSATSGGNITYDGGTLVTARGVVWSTNPNPTLDDNFTLVGSGTGSFVSEMSGLTHATTYYVRAYATNAIGTTYGNQRTFTTQSGIVALTTNAVTNIIAFSANSGGNITAEGGTPVTIRGLVWSTNPNPTLDDNFTTAGSGTGSFTSEMTGLTHATIYYVRAYATNVVGTTYGNQRSFSTQNGIIAITTNGISNVTANSATSGGNITNDGGTSVVARGVVWSLNPGPTLADNFTADGSGMGSFTSVISGLTANVYYFVRAYATNGTGTYYGNERSFFTFDCGSLLTDVDNNTYNTVLVGNQCWMKENLKTTKYRNGITIENPTGNSDWQNNTTGAYAWYNNDIGWKDSYGALYNWYAINNTNGLCPSGWHVPSNDEFWTMTNHLGGVSVAGGKMKSIRTVPDPHPRWGSPNTAATNESNWSGLPGGHRPTIGEEFTQIGYFGYWWSSTEVSPTFALFLTLGYESSYVWIHDNTKGLGLSVRCIKD